MIDYQQIFHVGVLVTDLDQAMQDQSPLALTWTTVAHSPTRSVWTPARGLEHVEISFVYSCEGPQHIELIVGQPGSLWDAAVAPGLHHIGMFAADVGAATEHCLAAGWTLVGAALSPDDGFGAFSYVKPPSGPIVEFVTATALPAVERWWAGEPLER